MTEGMATPSMTVGFLEFYDDWGVTDATVLEDGSIWLRFFSPHGQWVESVKVGRLNVQRRQDLRVYLQ